MRLLPPPCPDCMAEPPGELAEFDVPEGAAWRHYCQAGQWRRAGQMPSGQRFELAGPELRSCPVCHGITHGTSHPASGPASCPGNPARRLYPYVWEEGKPPPRSSPPGVSWAPAAAAYAILAAVLALFGLVALAVLLASLGG